jgi:glycerol-3-phosphate dehydrogenase (NAD(P)+)
MSSAPIGVLGLGSWGSALACAEATAGRAVVGWARRSEVVESIERRRRSPALPDVPLPEGLRATSRLADLAGCEPVLIAVASHGLRSTVREFLAASAGRGAVTLVSAAKGVETDTLARMSEVCREEAEAAGRSIGFAVLSGPTFAAEVAGGVPSAAVIASDEPGLAGELRQALSTPTFRFYSSTDLVGVELAGTAKNVIAIAAGTVTGLGLGHNTLAALITRGLHEITRLGVAAGGDPRTFAGLAGLGDLVLTCTGGLSRNRRVGLALAAGKTLEEALAETDQVAEGVRNSLAIAALARRLGVEMPITEQMVAVLHHGQSPRRALEELMRRELKAETQL